MLISGWKEHWIGRVDMSSLPGLCHCLAISPKQDYFPSLILCFLIFKINITDYSPILSHGLKNLHQVTELNQIHSEKGDSRFCKPGSIPLLFQETFHELCICAPNYLCVGGSQINNIYLVFSFM